MRPPPPPTTSTKVTASVKMLLLSQVAKKLENERTKLRKDALKLAKPAGAREKGADTVLCQCGHLEEEGGEMVCQKHVDSHSAACSQ